MVAFDLVPKQQKDSMEDHYHNFKPLGLMDFMCALLGLLSNSQ